MRDEGVPGELLAAYDRLTESAAEHDGMIARANELPMPELAPVDPEQLGKAAASAGAPPELRAVAGAVAEGRTTWAEIAVGGARDLPEVRDLLQASADRLAREMHTQSAKPARPTRPEPEPDDVSDFSEQSFMRNDW